MPPQTTARSQFTREFDRLCPSTKNAFENLTKLKNHGGNDADTNAATRAALAALRMEQKLANGDPFARFFDEPWKAVYLAGVFKALARRHTREIRLTDEEEQVCKAIGTDTSPGSTLITPALQQEIYDLLYDAGDWKTFGIEPMDSRQTKFAIITARPDGKFITSDGGSLSDDATAAGTSISPEAGMVAARWDTSNQFLQDSSITLGRAMLSALVDGVNARISYACLQGSGASDENNGGVNGLFDAGTGIGTTTAAAGNTTLQTCDRDDFLNVIEGVDAPALQRAPRWWMSPALLPKLMRVNLSGQQILKTALELGGADEAFVLVGFPLTLAGGAPSSNTAGSRVALFGDGNGLGVGVRQDILLESSPHPTWNKLVTAFRAFARVAIKVKKTGAFNLLKTSAT